MRGRIRLRRVGRAKTALRLALLLLGLNLLWRLVRYGMVFPLWGDEARVAVSLFDRDPAGLLEPLDYLQIVPLLFLWAEWGISRLLGMGELALRLLPVVAGVLSVFVFWRLSRETLDRRSRLAAVALFAASYYPVRHATEVKPYSLDLLVAAGLLLLGWRALEGCRGLLGFALVVSFGAMLAVVGRTQAEAGSFLLEHSHWERAFPPVAEPWRIPAWLVEVHCGNLFAYPNGGPGDFGEQAHRVVAAGLLTGVVA